MRRVAIVAVAVAGLGLLGTGVRGVAALDGRLADAIDDPPAREVEVRQELRDRDDCPGPEHRDEARPPLMDERRL
jgi:hypothetical protein